MNHVLVWWLITAATDIWPTSVAGWASLLVSVVAAVSIPIAWGRILEKLNGYGKRLSDAELDIGRLDERGDQFKLDIQRILDAQQNEVKVMSQIDAKADAAFKAVETHQREILSRFDSFLQQKNESQTAIRERLSRLEQQVMDDRNRGVR